ncbi:class I SAM-dependent methyltransferase [Prescottella subtropica]|uniref:class I SAM-dependent methyltransferase n=1 Tax=Prescottella subtropica TaxID=2545757 RepID=UPI0010F44764|nr:class I SAM-dependent methyltransferase [Prescottella subtropica]
MEQPGYDAVADLYVRTFPSPYLTVLERHAVAMFAELVHAGPAAGTVVDVGCGPGRITADLDRAGLDVIGVDPSTEMLRIARTEHPHLRFVLGDAVLDTLPTVTVRAILARYSLIHVAPANVPAVLDRWFRLLVPGAIVAIVGQATDEVGAVTEFDHAVAPAWRWHPDRLATVLDTAGFDEVWRTVSRPDADHRFPDVHLAARRR